MCDGSICDITNGNDNLKLCNTMLFDQGVLIVGGEHQSRLIYHKATMDTALMSKEKQCTSEQHSNSINVKRHTQQCTDLYMYMYIIFACVQWYTYTYTYTYMYLDYMYFKQTHLIFTDVL